MSLLDATIGGFFEAITPLLLVAFGVWIGRVWSRQRIRRADRVRFAWILRTDAEFDRWIRNRVPARQRQRNSFETFLERR